MAQLGADVEALDQLAKQFHAEADKIKHAISTIGAWRRFASSWVWGSGATTVTTEKPLPTLSTCSSRLCRLVCMAEVLTFDFVGHVVAPFFAKDVSGVFSRIE